DWCMAACYSADEDGTVRLPFDPATSELVPEVWERWLAWDPVRMAPGHAEALRGMRAIYIDAGKRDQWFLDLGAEAFRRALGGLDRELRPPGLVEANRERSVAEGGVHRLYRGGVERRPVVGEKEAQQRVAQPVGAREVALVELHVGVEQAVLGEPLGERLGGR